MNELLATETQPVIFESIKSRINKFNLSEVALIRKTIKFCKPNGETQLIPIDCPPDLKYRNTNHRSSTTLQEDIGVELTTFSYSDINRPSFFPKPLQQQDPFRCSLEKTKPKESSHIQENIPTLQKEVGLKFSGTNNHSVLTNNSKICLYKDSLVENNAPYTESNQDKFRILTSKDDKCLDCRDFSNVDQHAANFDRQYVSSIASLAYDLCNPFDLKVDKARAIFTWLHHNIAYDTKSFFDNNVRHQTPETTLRTGLSVCQGYAELFEKLANHAGLEALVISGHGKGYGYKYGSCDYVLQLKNHAWNAVKLDCGNWQLIDPCWGAGHVDNNQIYIKLFKPTAFTSSPETFRRKHFPANGKYQFCERELSWDEYVNMEEQPLIYSEFINKEFSEVTIQPCFRTIKPESTKFIITSKCRHTHIAPEDQYVLLLNVDGIYTPFKVDSRGMTWTCETSAITESSCTVQVDLLEMLGSRNAKGISVEEYVQTAQNSGYSLCTLCSWDIKK